MNFSLDKIEELYGVSVISDLKDNMDSVKHNIRYLNKRGFTEIEDLFECYPFTFILSEDIFQERVNHFIEKYGVEYIEKIKENTSLWEEIENEF